MPPPTSQKSAPRVAALRARRAALGLVRLELYARPEHHGMLTMTPNTLYRPVTPGVTYRDAYDRFEYVPWLGMVRLCNDEVLPIDYATDWVEVTE